MSGVSTLLVVTSSILSALSNKLNPRLIYTDYRENSDLYISRSSFIDLYTHIGELIMNFVTPD